jgi:hypothetical protein
MTPRCIPILLLNLALQATAAETSLEEYQVKGAYLLNFARFTAWPAESFKSPEDPIAICVLGQNPFGTVLDRATQNLTVANRAVVVRQIPTVQQAAQCHIVFISSSEKKKLRALLDNAQGNSILTVGESDGFLAGGGVISFKLDGDRVRIEINKEAADRAHLRISAKLLSLAQAVKK